jgi:hypothetical protein
MSEDKIPGNFVFMIGMKVDVKINDRRSVKEVRSII